jgi:hypothetical protein
MIIVEKETEADLAGHSFGLRGGVQSTFCHTPVLKSRTEASIHVPRIFNHTHSNNMINR